jgi:lipoprotein-anchoring transpeptidase ErfK/SrfK
VAVELRLIAAAKSTVNAAVKLRALDQLAVLRVGCAIFCLLAAGCGSSHSPTRRKPYTSVRPASAPTLPSGPGPLVAEVLRPTAIRVAPDGRVLARIGTRDEFGSPDALAVQRLGPYWLGVLSPFAGNGRIGWIPRSAALLSRTPYRLEASLAARTLVVRYLGRVVKRYTIGIGAAWAPTPAGHFAVTDRLTTGNPGGPYGCCILALSATAPHAIPGWPGGNRIAIHATPATETIGQPDSHGCLHVTQAEARWLVFHVPIGTRIDISG